MARTYVHFNSFANANICFFNAFAVVFYGFYVFEEFFSFFSNVEFFVTC